MPSRIAARSRGPPRPTTRRASARARSGAALRRSRTSAARSVRDEMPDRVVPRARSRAGSVSGAASRCASRREPAAVTVRSIAASSEPRRSPAERAHEFEIGARRLVDGERRALRLAHRRRQRRALAELGALHIGDAGGRRRELEPRQRAERLGGRDREITGEPPLGGGAVEHVAGERRHRRQRAQVGRQLGVAVERVRDDDLAGLEPRDLGGKPRRGRIRRCGTRRSRCRSRRARSGFSSPAGGARARDREEIIVAPRIEQRVLGERAGRDQAHHVAAHHALVAALPRLGRVLELLADRDAMAERDQAMQIFVGAIDRHAAHRDVAAEMLAALGEHDAERARGGSRRPRRTARRNRPSGRTAGNPDWRP